MKVERKLNEWYGTRVESEETILARIDADRGEVVVSVNAKGRVDSVLICELYSETVDADGQAVQPTIVMIRALSVARRWYNQYLGEKLLRVGLLRLCRAHPTLNQVALLVSRNALLPVDIYRGLGFTVVEVVPAHFKTEQGLADGLVFQHRLPLPAEPGATPDDVDVIQATV